MRIRANRSLVSELGVIFDAVGGVKDWRSYPDGEGKVNSVLTGRFMGHPL